VTAISDFGKFPASDKFHYVCGWGIDHSKRREQSFECSQDYMPRILQSMVFGYGQFDDGRKILLEWNDVTAMRTMFVRKM